MHKPGDIVAYVHAGSTYRSNVILDNVDISHSGSGPIVRPDAVMLVIHRVEKRRTIGSPELMVVAAGGCGWIFEDLVMQVVTWS